MRLTELFELIKQETRLKPEWDDPNYLADLLLRLASYYASLGEFLAEAERDADLSEVSYKAEKESVAANLMATGSSAAAASSVSVVESEEKRKEYINLKYQSRLLFVHRQSLEKTMDAVRSKLSYLKRDREEARNG